MASYHVLEVAASRDQIRVAFHFPVPAENNVAGRPLSGALVESRSPVSVVPYLSQGEKDAVAAGTVYEHVEMVAMSGHLTDQERIAVLDSRTAVLASRLLTQIRAQLAFWGYERTP